MRTHVSLRSDHELHQYYLMGFSCLTSRQVPLHNFGGSTFLRSMKPEVGGYMEELSVGFGTDSKMPETVSVHLYS